MDKRKIIIIALGSFTLFSVVILIGIFFVIPNMQHDDREALTDPFGNSSEDRPNGPVTGNVLPSNTETVPSEGSETEIQLKDGSILRRISAEPVAGAVPYLSKGEPFVRYTERYSGDTFDTPIANPTSPKVLDDVESLRGVENALWSPTASTSITLSLNMLNDIVFSDIYLFAGPEESSSTVSVTEPVVTRRVGFQDPLGIAFSPDGTLFAVLVSEERGSALYIERVDSGTRRRVWSSPLRGLTLRWASPQRITVYTNPDDDLMGAAWSVDPANGSSKLLMGNKFALAVLPHPTENLMLYSQRAEAGIYSLRVFHTDGKEDTYLSSPTLAEKCVWGANGPYVYCAIPKNMNLEGFIGKWYRGEISSNDTVWRYDATTGAGKRILDPEEASGYTFDMIDLAVDPTDSYLLFRDRLSGELWSLELPQKTSAADQSAPTSTAPGF